MNAILIMMPVAAVPVPVDMHDDCILNIESIGEIHLLKLFEINFYFVFILFVIKVYKIMSRLLSPLQL